LNRLAYLRYDGPEVAEIAERIFSEQRKDGSWAIYPGGRGQGRRPLLYEGWTMIPQQTSLPLRGLASAGYATDPRAERAYEWLLGYERTAGMLTFYANFDLAFLLDIATSCGVSADDARVADLVEFLEGMRGAFGLWQHRQHPQLSRWLTLDLETSLAGLRSGT